LIESKVLGSRHNAQSVGVAHTSTPALDTDDSVTLAEHTKLDSVHDTPLETAVDILLPWFALEVGLVLGEIEGVDTTVQV
jgi:hypothetical protein